MTSSDPRRVWSVRVLALIGVGGVLLSLWINIPGQLLGLSSGLLADVLRGLLTLAFVALVSLAQHLRASDGR